MLGHGGGVELGELATEYDERFTEWPDRHPLP